jgi:hypothetical protein
MADVPSRVIELVETFDRNIDAYRSPQYNETQLRREFIDPFFDQFVYKLYNLTEEEIKIIEEATDQDAHK